MALGTALGLAWVARRMRWRGGVARRIVVLFAFVAVILLLNAIIVHRFVTQDDASERFLKVASDQWLLCQTVDLLAGRVLEGDASAPLLTEKMGNYESTLQRLERAGDSEVFPRASDLAAPIANVRRSWNGVQGPLQRLLEEPLEIPDARKSVLERLERFRHDSLQVVLVVENWRQELRRNLLYLIGGTSLGGLVALVIWFNFAWIHLVTPVRRLRDHALKAKERPTRMVPKNEIEAVAEAVTELSTDRERLRRERARMRGDLKRAEADYKSIFENAVAGILRFDAAGSVLMANRALVRILGYSSDEELIAEVTDVHEKLFAHPNHRARFEDLCRRRGQVELETQARRKDGSTLWVLESASVGQSRGGAEVYETVIVDITAMKKAQNSLRELSGLLLRSQDRERRRIARELHDSTGQLLAALELNLGRLDEVMPVMRDSLSSSMELATECTRQIRSMSYLLHPPMLEELGLVYALRDYVRGFSQRGGIEVGLDVPPDLERLPSDAELALFRVVQEALANIQRHSGSPDALIRVISSPGWIRLEVEDHGRGIVRDRLTSNGEPSLMNMGVGMRGMEERLRQLGGRLTVESERGRTLIRAEVPYGEEEEVSPPGQSAYRYDGEGLDKAIT